MDVKIKLASVEREVDHYRKHYRSQMDMLESSVLAKVKGGLDLYDYWSLGKQLEQYEIYQALVEEAGNVNLLGRIPTLAFDVITAIQGVSILPVVASVQPIDDERGTVYFKNVRSEDTRGSQTSGDIVVDPKSGIVTPSGYASNFISGEVGVALTVDGTVDYTFTLLYPPIRSETLKLTFTGSATIVAEDVGPRTSNKNLGSLFGSGLSGTINYTTGEVIVKFATNPGAGESIIAEYQQNLEQSTDIPKIQTFFDSTTIHARIYALKGQIGMLQSYGMRKRFGMVAEDEISRDLVAEVNKEVGGDLIRKLKTVAIGTTEWPKTPPAGISYFEHKQTFKDKMAEAERVLAVNAGRGTISVLIAGSEMCEIIQTLPGFKKLFDGTSLGAHVYGTLDGLTVVRVLESALLPQKEGIALWKGPTPFEAAAVWSPYMPLTVTGTLPEAPNPLRSQRAAAVWAGVDALVPNFATKFNVVVGP